MDLKEKEKAQLQLIEQFSEISPCITMVHKIADASIVWMCKRGLKELDIDLNTLTNLGKDDYYGRYFNLEDAKDYVPKILSLLERNNDEECVSYFQQVKINGQEEWTWHMSSTRIFMRDHLKQPVLTITQSIPIDTMHTMSLKAERILEENNFLKANINTFLNLTPRELEILKHLAKGESATECGEKLFISPQTVETHRKNIRKKLGTTSFFELTKYARAFDLI